MQENQKKELTQSQIENLPNKSNRKLQRQLSDGDNTDMSTHGSIRSKQQKYFDTYPELIDKTHNKKKPKIMVSSAGKNQNKNKRRLSMNEEPEYREIIQEAEDFLSEESEEQESDDMSEGKKYSFRHVQFVQDQQEFQERISRKVQNFKPNREKSNYTYATRMRAQSYDKSKLPKVIEVIGDLEEEQNRKHNNIFSNQGIDKNEFNQSQNTAKRGSIKKLNLNQNQNQDTIKEEYESEKQGNSKQKKSKFSKGENINSPRYNRLQVDELDSKKKDNIKNFSQIDEDYEEGQYNQDIEPIQEEEKENAWDTDGVQKLEQRLEKLHREVNKIAEDDEQQQIIDAQKNFMKSEENSKVVSIKEIEEIDE